MFIFIKLLKYILVYLAFALWKVQLCTVQSLLLKPWSFCGLRPLDPHQGSAAEPHWGPRQPPRPRFESSTLHQLTPPPPLPSCQPGYGPDVSTPTDDSSNVLLAVSSVTSLTAQFIKINLAKQVIPTYLDRTREFWVSLQLPPFLTGCGISEVANEIANPWLTQSRPCCPEHLA